MFEMQREDLDFRRLDIVSDFRSASMANLYRHRKLCQNVVLVDRLSIHPLVVHLVIHKIHRHYGSCGSPSDPHDPQACMTRSTPVKRSTRTRGSRIIMAVTSR